MSKEELIEIDAYWFREDELQKVLPVVKQDVSLQKTQPGLGAITKVWMHLRQQALYEQAHPNPFEEGKMVITQTIYAEICRVLGKDELTENMNGEQSVGHRLRQSSRLQN